jgi:membrane-associated phospholipid phosphatase
MNETIGVIQAAQPAVFDGVLAWGLDCIRLIQEAASPGLTSVMRVLTNLGGEYFYIALLLFIYWCVSERQGFRLGLVLLLSGAANSAVKIACKQPRPYDLDPSLGLSFESTFGFPSGHAQNALVFWGALVPGLGRRIGRLKAFVVALLLILVVAFTRLYLGVHFPTDILGGWLLGGVLLILYRILNSRISALLQRGGIRLQVIVIAALAFLMNALGVDRNISGLFFGFNLGYALMLQKLRFSARAAAPGLRVLALRYLIGLSGALLLYLGLRFLLPGDGSPNIELGRFIRYGCIGFWAAFGAPWVFMRLHLAARAS